MTRGAERASPENKDTPDLSLSLTPQRGANARRTDTKERPQASHSAHCTDGGEAPTASTRISGVADGLKTTTATGAAEDRACGALAPDAHQWRSAP
eukprot:7218842-Prymnesium_polylepis.1